MRTRASVSASPRRSITRAASSGAPAKPYISTAVSRSPRSSARRAARTSFPLPKMRSKTPTSGLLPYHHVMARWHRALLFLPLIACGGRTALDDGSYVTTDGGGGDVDAGPPKQKTSNKLDMLFAIDNSASM